MAGGVPAGTLSIEIVASIAKLQEDMRRAEKAVGDMGRVVGGSANAITNSFAKVERSSGSMRAGMQQLSYQMGDVATQFAAGTPAMIIFAQQSGQVVQALGLMTNGSKGLIGFLGGPWGQIMMASVTILGTLASAYFGASEASDKHKDAAKELKDAIDDLHGATVRSAQSTWAGIQADIDKANSLRLRTIETRKTAIAELQLAQARRSAATASADQNVYGNNILSRSMAATADSQAQALAKQIADLNKQVGKADETIRLKRGKQIGMEVAAQFDKGAAAALTYDRALDRLNGQLQRGTISEGAYRSQLAAITEAREAATAQSERRSRGLSAEAKAAREAAKEYEKLAKWLADTRMEAQGNVGKIAEGIFKDQAESGKGLLDILAKADAAWKDNALLGLSGEALELAKLNQEIEELRKQFGGAGVDAVALENALERYRAARTAGINQKTLLEKDADAAAILLDQLGALSNMRGVFGSIGGLLSGMATGNFSGMGGKVGGMMDMLSTMKTGQTIEVDGKEIAETLGDKLKDIFSKNGEFFAGLSAVLANAALGSTAAGLAGGSKLGGGIGGAIGGFLTGKNGPFGKALESGLNSVFQGLGSFAGPLGSIAGGLLGGALGGLFKPKPKYGSASLYMNEYGDLAGTSGNGNAGSAIRAASGLASNVADGLNSIAEQLGAKITGVPNIALGTYDGKYRVNVEGRGGKMDFKGNSAKGLYSFGEDEQAAIEFAIQKSIEGAVLSGISQASINILKSGQDLQKAIEKATLIEDIPRELQRRLDPVGYAIDELNKKWLKTVEALREGGATSQQMADAQKLYNMEMVEAKENAGQAAQALKDFLKSMNMGPNSPLSLRDQAANAQKALDPFLAQINAGQAINQDKYLEAAQTYLDIERQMYGSTARYFEAFDQIQAATNKAIATVDNAAPIRTTSDPFIEQTAAATKSMEANTANMVTLMEQNVELQKENNALLQKVAAKGETWTGSLRNYGS